MPEAATRGELGPIRLAISTCPNDTFAFHAILNRKVDLQGLDLEIQLLDISELNSGLFAGSFDVAKCSFHAALKLATDYTVLPSGSALGFGNGPLLLASAAGTTPETQQQLTLCPGAHTTASLLFQLFYNQTRVEQVVFSEIMPGLCRREADFGVCIHEGRFTYQDSNLFLVSDLGKRWEAETSCPLPLGGIVARKSLDRKLQLKIQNVIQDSIRYALENREETAATMRQYAQEFNDEVLFRHVDLYVNDWTIDLGSTGATALEKFSELATARLSLPTASQLTIFNRLES